MHNDNGINNAAFGVDALASNSSGGDNTASGTVALFSNTTGNDNTATGFEALYNNTIGTDNTAATSHHRGPSRTERHGDLALGSGREPPKYDW